MSLIWNEIEEHVVRCESCIIRLQCLPGSSDTDDKKQVPEPERAKYVRREPSYWRRKQWSEVSPFGLLDNRIC